MTVTINQSDLKKVLAEVVGTFFFFFIGIASAAWGGQPAGLTILYVALAHGLALSIAVSALGHVSGGHFNPAVTISLAVTRKISPVLAAFYVLGQIIGGILAALAVLLCFPNNTVQASVPHVSSSIYGWVGIVLEAILTFFLVLVVFGTAVDDRASRIGGFGIGLTVFVDILIGGPLTGAAMNPARAIAPAIVAGDLKADQLVYWVGPIIGGIVAALVYFYFFLPQPGEEVVTTAPPSPTAPAEVPLSEPALTHDRNRD